MNSVSKVAASAASSKNEMMATNTKQAIKICCHCSVFIDYDEENESMDYLPGFPVSV